MRITAFNSIHRRSIRVRALVLAGSGNDRCAFPSHRVKDFAQTVEVSLGLPPFGRDEPFRAHEGASGVDARTSPMSASLGTPFTKMMFDGLMSRWTRPLV